MNEKHRTIILLCVKVIVVLKCEGAFLRLLMKRWKVTTVHKYTKVGGQWQSQYFSLHIFPLLFVPSPSAVCLSARWGAAKPGQTKTETCWLGLARPSKRERTISLPVFFSLPPLRLHLFAFLSPPLPFPSPVSPPLCLWPDSRWVTAPGTQSQVVWASKKKKEKKIQS